MITSLSERRSSGTSSFSPLGGGESTSSSRWPPQGWIRGGLTKSFSTIDAHRFFHRSRLAPAPLPFMMMVQPWRICMKWTTWTVCLVLVLVLSKACLAQILGNEWSTSPRSHDVEDQDSYQQTFVSKVKVDVYYETNCPDSMDFITKQLKPTFERLSNFMEINLIPFGKAWEQDTPEGEYRFYCHHGPAECFGNTVQACAIHLYPNVKEHLEFISCMQSFPIPSSAAAKCARRSSLDYSRIEKCSKGRDGNQYLHQMAVRTKKLQPPLNFVPWIVMNGVYNESIQRESLKNLQSVICNLYKGTKPSSCFS